MCLSLVKSCKSFIKLFIPSLQARDDQAKLFFHTSDFRGNALNAFLELFNDDLQIINPLIIRVLIYPLPEWCNGRVFEKENPNRMISTKKQSQLSSFKTSFIEREDLFGFSDDVDESRMFFNIGLINSKEVVVLVLTVQCLYCQDIGAVELEDDLKLLV